jgi:hypothetical protein
VVWPADACFPLPSCLFLFRHLQQRVRRRCLISNPQPCDDTQDDFNLSFEGNAIPMTCSISPPWASHQTESFTPELLLHPQPQALPQRMPLLRRRGHENTAGSISPQIGSSSNSSRCTSSSRTKKATTMGGPPREISLSCIVQPEPRETAASSSSPQMDYYRIPLRDVLLVDTMLPSAGNSAAAAAEPGTTTVKLVLILPTHALELDCISRNSYDLILACLEAFIKKSKIRKVKKSKKKNKKNSLFPGKSRSSSTNNATSTCTTTISNDAAGGTTNSSCYAFSLPSTIVLATTAAKSNNNNKTAGDAMTEMNMLQYSSNCSSVDALTDHIMFLAAESESLVDKLGRRIGKCMADISEALLL